MKQKSNQFCLDILDQDIKRATATANVVMSLASYQEARSPTELSLSPVYHYQYGSISKAVAELSSEEASRVKVQQAIRKMCLPYYESCEEHSLSDWLLLQTDTTPIGKAHSPTLEDRTYIPVPNNVIPGNKSLDIGYEASFINLSEPASCWSLPLSVKRVQSRETATECALEQLQDIFSQPDLALEQQACINTLDSKYGNAAYLSPAHQHKHLVNVVRLRAGMKVYTHQPRTNTGGAHGVYGDKFYLHRHSRWKKYDKHPKTKQPYQVWQRSIFEQECENLPAFEAKMGNGRKVCIKLWRWNDKMIRSKNGHNMKDKPFDLVAVEVRDSKSQELVFDKQLFFAIAGEQKAKLATEPAYQAYRHRYDIEPYFRFTKQRLMLQKYQTSIREHFENWLLVIFLTTWLLFAASKEAHYRPRKWEQYLPENKPDRQTARLTIAKTRKAVQALFLTFDPMPFKPLKSKKGRPRQKGETQKKRTRFPVVKKSSRAGALAPTLSQNRA